MGFPLFGGAKPSEPVLVDRLEATVGGDPIFYSQVKDRMAEGPAAQVRLSHYPAENSAPPHEKILQDLINYKLLEQEAEQLGLEVTDQGVEARIKEILQSNKMEKEDLQGFLEVKGLTYDDYKETVRGQMLLMKFQGRVIMPKVRILESEIEGHYLTKYKESAVTTSFLLAQIQIRLSPNASTLVASEKRKLAWQAYEKLKSSPFSDIAEIYSDKKSQDAWYQLSDLSSEIQNKIIGLKKGGVTEPVQTSLGFHLFSIKETKTVPRAKYLKLKKSLEMELRNRSVQSQVTQWIRGARKKNKILILKK